MYADASLLTFNGSISRYPGTFIIDSGSKSFRYNSGTKNLISKALDNNPRNYPIGLVMGLKYLSTCRSTQHQISWNTSRLS